MKFALIKNSIGSGIVIALIAAGVLSSASVYLYTTYENSLKIGQQAIYKNTALLIRSNIMALVNGTTAWNNTILANPVSMSCLQWMTDPVTYPIAKASLPNCVKEDLNAPNGKIGQTFILKDANNITYYDSTSGLNGLTFDGKLCQRPSLTSGFAACPIGLNMRWIAVCGNYCNIPQVDIELEFFYNGARKSISSTSNLYYREARHSTSKSNFTNICGQKGKIYLPNISVLETARAAKGLPSLATVSGFVGKSVGPDVDGCVMVEAWLDQTKSGPKGRKGRDGLQPTTICPP